MDFFVAGVIHHDPLGPDKLTDWLRTLRQAHADPPAFIAVEFASYVFQQIREQRGTLEQLAQREWPEASPELIRALAPSLAYEADTHPEVFRQHIEVLWLDEFRQPEPYPGAAQDFARDRLCTYKSLLLNEELSLPIPDALATMSQAAWDKADRESRENPPQPEPRDEEFALQITQRLRQGGGEWAIAVVGRNHASDQEGSMLRRLLDGGIPCNKAILDPRNLPSG